jgi:glycosyltransferase involved in cell wall biosynthesis
MRIAAFRPTEMPESFRVYCDGLISEFEGLSCRVVCFEHPDAKPSDADVIWDPRAGGGNPPPAGLCGLPQPLVVAVHGVAPMAIPITEYFGDWRGRVRGLVANRRKKAAWNRLRGEYAAVVTGTELSKRSIVEVLPIDPEQIAVCHYGVDHQTFRPGAALPKGGYLLHVSNDEPRKNVDRICAAHGQLPSAWRLPLKLKLPFHTRRESGRDIEIIRTRLADDELARLYQGALGFVFPSLYEGFGLPILEAMACGCPVITSRDDACAEVAGESAITVDPRSVAELRDAMQSLLDDDLRSRLKAAGLRRAGQFSWAASAACHLAVFEKAAREWCAG